MDIYTVDWAHGKVNVLKHGDPPEKQKIYHDLDEFFDKLFEPSGINLESTFESFFRATKRNAIIARAEREGHIFLTLPPRATGIFKERKYGDKYRKKKFPDELAVELLRDMVLSGVHLKKPRLYDPDDPWIPRREAACRELMKLRYTKVERLGRNGAPLKNMISAKEELARQVAEEVLIPFEELDPDMKNVLGDGTQRHYNYTLLALIVVAARHVNNRKEFDKLVGMYHHGYPNIFRSDFFHHVYRHLAYRNGVTENTPENRELMNKLRKGSRWIFSCLNQQPSVV